MKRTILKESKVIHESGMLPSCVVLCHIPDSVQPFVTWIMAWREDGVSSTFWGHYFNDIDSALVDFNERAKRYQED